MLTMLNIITTNKALLLHLQEWIDHGTASFFSSTIVIVIEGRLPTCLIGPVLTLLEFTPLRNEVLSDSTPGRGDVVGALLPEPLLEVRVQGSRSELCLFLCEDALLFELLVNVVLLPVHVGSHLDLLRLHRLKLPDGTPPLDKVPSQWLRHLWDLVGEILVHRKNLLVDLIFKIMRAFILGFEGTFEGDDANPIPRSLVCIFDGGKFVTDHVQFEHGLDLPRLFALLEQVTSPV